MPADVIEVQEVASAVVDGTGLNRTVRGCVAARTAQGIYTITINPNNLAGPNLPQSESVSKVNLVGTASRAAELVHTSSTVKTITIRDAAGADQDNDFSVRLSRLLG